MENAGKARSYGLYRHLRTSKEIIKNLSIYYINYFKLHFEYIVLINLHLLNIII